VRRDIPRLKSGTISSNTLAPSGPRRDLRPTGSLPFLDAVLSIAYSHGRHFVILDESVETDQPKTSALQYSSASSSCGIPLVRPVVTVADLKGKKVAFNKGSDVHWLVVKALEDAGLKYSDIQPAYLAPADARAAFQNGAIDAWAIWDPFFVAAQRQIGARVLTTAKGIVNRHQYFVSTRSFSEKNAEVVKILIQELGEVGQWVRDNYAEAAKELAPIQGLEPDIIEASLRHYEHIYKPIDDAVLADQQRIADTFYAPKLIPQKLSVKDAVMKPK
jgi:sulfonate transport system substrate-binding protein